MKYSAYIVSLKYKETSFTATLAHEGAVLTAHFKKIGTDLFVVALKVAEEFRFLQEVTLKDRAKDMVVLLPLEVEEKEYNKRKLTKLSKILEVEDVREIHAPGLILKLLEVERFLIVGDYLEFFGMDEDVMRDFLVEKELVREIQLIEVACMTIISPETLESYRSQLNALFTDCYTGRIQALLLTEIEEKIGLLQPSLFFKYLLLSFQDRYSYKIHRDRIVFQKLALTETEKDSLSEIEKTLKKNKRSLFSIDDILQLTGLTYKDVNATLWFMVDNGQVVRLDEEHFMFAEDLQKILNKLKKYKRNQGEWIDIPAIRDMTLLSRKYIITLLEYFDAQQITERVNNQRRILLGV